MADFKYEIVEHIGTLSESAKRWTKELNKISWNGGEPKYDIRDWAPEHEKMGKGVTLSEDEMAKLKTYCKYHLNYMEDQNHEQSIRRNENQKKYSQIQTGHDSAGHP